MMKNIKTYESFKPEEYWEDEFENDPIKIEQNKAYQVFRKDFKRFEDLAEKQGFKWYSLKPSETSDYVYPTELFVVTTSSYLLKSKYKPFKKEVIKFQ